MFGHDDQCCQYVEHDDGFSFYYLREDPTNLYITQGKKLVDHAVQITGQQGECFWFHGDRGAVLILA